MKQIGVVILALGALLLPAPAVAQLAEDEVAAAQAALEGLIQSGTLPAAETLGTFRILDATPPRNREFPDNTDRVLQQMGVEVEPGRVTQYVCEAVPPARGERTGEGEELRLCRYEDGRNPVLILRADVSGSEAVVVVGTETLYGAPTRRCVGVTGATYEVRVARSPEGAWRFAEVLRASEWYGTREPCWGPSSQG